MSTISVGYRKGSLTALKFVSRSQKREQIWLFRCDCGNEIVTKFCRVRRGETASCGCLRQKTAAENGRNSRTTHGMWNSSEYTTWINMLARCLNPKSPNFRYYGKRGIKVCSQWQKFESFYADMGLKPSTKHTLERIDNNGNYEPSNCKWATWDEQVRNKRKYGTC